MNKEFQELQDLKDIIITTAKLMGYKVKQTHVYTIIHYNNNHTVTFSLNTRSLTVYYRNPPKKIQETASHQKKLNILNNILKKL